LISLHKLHNINCSFRYQ